MKKIFLSLSIILMSTVVLAQTNANLSKMNLRTISRMNAKEKRYEGNVRRAQVIGKKEERSGLMLKIKNNADEHLLLERYRMRKFSRQGNILIVTLPTDSIASLSLHSDVLKLEQYVPRQRQNDIAATTVGADKVWKGDNLIQAFTGKGVIAGITDCFFDFTHPTFYDADGNLRIKAFWDSFMPTVSGENVHWGHIMRGDELLTAQHSSEAKRGTHGTHVLGTMAGSGDLSNDSKWRGIAWEADIIGTTTYWGGDDTLVVVPVNDDAHALFDAGLGDALAFEFIFREADSLGMPCVINYSVGEYNDFYNDWENTAEKEYIGNLLTPGHILVVAACNSGNSRGLYYKNDGANTTNLRMALHTQEPFFTVRSQGEAEFEIERGNDVFRLKSHEMDAITDANPDAHGTIVITPDSISENGITLTWYKKAQNNTGFDYGYYFQFNITDAAWEQRSQAPIYIKVIGKQNGLQEIMANEESCYFTNAITGVASSGKFTPYTIGIPACYDNVIAAGATLHRHDFENLDGTTVGWYTYYNTPTGYRVPFSSVGPTNSGRIKPDVCAPGLNIISAVSSFNEEELYTEYYADVTSHNGKDYYWAGVSGTSQASPVVAGSIALWLQAKPDLTYQEALEIIKKTARQTKTEITYPNNEYGHGEIDAYKGLLEVLSLTSINEISTRQPSGVNFCVADNILKIQFSEQPQQDYTVKFYSTSGALMKTLKMEQIVETIDISDFPSGVYAVQLNTNNKQTTGSTLIRK